MRVLIITLLFLCSFGCKKKPLPPADTSASDNGMARGPGGGIVVNPNEAMTSKPSGQPPGFVSSSNSSTAPNQNGNLTVTGGQGAIQSPRMAAARTMNLVQLNQLHLSMFQTFQLDNRVPSAAEIIAEAKQNPQLNPLIQDEVLILTDTKLGNGIWVYSKYPQRMGEHYVITQLGVVQMSPEALKAKLEEQRSPVKIEK